MTPLTLIHQLPPRVVIYTQETPDARFKKPLFMRHEMTLLILLHQLPAHAGNIYAGIFRTLVLELDTTHVT